MGEHFTKSSGSDYFAPSFVGFIKALVGFTKANLSELLKMQISCMW